MTSLSRSTRVWALLSALTVVAWLGGYLTNTGAQLVPSTTVTIGVLALGAVKSRFVLRTFMDVETAPRWLRQATDAWLVAVFGGVLVIYLV